jgi:hypothetical protein
MQLDVEIGNYDKVEQEYMNMVHYTARYLLGDGTTMTPETIDISMGVLSGVAMNAYGLPKVSALHLMSLLLSHTGQLGFASVYIDMTREAQAEVEHVEQVGIEYQ